jgi:hypothetical protein
MDSVYPDRFFLKGVKYLGWRTAFRKQVRTSGKLVQNTFYPFYKLYVILILKIFRTIFPSRYSDADPFKTIHVDPNNITYETEGPCRHRGWIVDGGWDTECRRIAESELYTCFERRFVDGETWEESGYIDFARDELKSGGNAWGLTSEEQIRDRCERLDSVWRSIKSEGYKSQTELLEENPEATYDQNVDSVHPELNEIGVDIGRDGDVLWNRVGHHRLIMATLLDIESVPVFVHRRHKQWQQTRDEVRRNPASCTGYHPDLIEIDGSLSSGNS